MNWMNKQLFVEVINKHLNSTVGRLIKSVETTFNMM